MKHILARDQYGNTLWLEGKHPRKELLEELGATHCQKQYRDKLDGTTVHNGFIVNGSWYTLYNVAPWEQSASNQ